MRSFLLRRVADRVTVENEEHCDFKKLRSLVIRTHMLDLISTSEDSHYENYRQAQMETRKFGYVSLSCVVHALTVSQRAQG